MLKILLDFFLGDKKYISIERLGVLESSIRKSSKKNDYSWSGSFRISTNKHHETFFILEGDKNGPFAEQVQSFYDLLDKIDYIKNAVTSELKKDKKIITKYKEDPLVYFFIETIFPDDIPDNSFEITFSAIHEDDSSYIDFVWRKNSVDELPFKLH